VTGNIYHCNKGPTRPSIYGTYK